MITDDISNDLAVAVAGIVLFSPWVHVPVSREVGSVFETGALIALVVICVVNAPRAFRCARDAAR